MAAIRRRARRYSAGFTLVELMIVVVLISMLAVIATPAMSVAHEDRIAFDSARRIEQLIQRTQARPQGRGAAHLFVAAPAGTPSRGMFLMFEALDGTLVTDPIPGPNPVSTCKGLNEWADVVTYLPGAVSSKANVIDGFTLDNPGINADMNLQTAFSVNGAVPVDAVVMCVQPGGKTFVGQGATVAAAIIDMQAQPNPFSTFLEITVTRNKGGVPIGIQRRVLVAGGAAGRIKSQ